MFFREERRMERYAEQQLLEWKNNPLRKPLLIMGARQVGKTWLMQEFGRKNFREVAFFNGGDNTSNVSQRL